MIIINIFGTTCRANSGYLNGKCAPMFKYLIDRGNMLINLHEIFVGNIYVSVKNYYVSTTGVLEFFNSDLFKKKFM